MESDLNHLIEQLNHEDSEVRIQACRSLKDSSYSETIEPLKSMLEDENKWVRRHATETLLTLTSVEDMIDQLIHLLDDSDPWVRCYASESLAQSADPKSIQPLIARLTDQDYHVRLTA